MKMTTKDGRILLLRAVSDGFEISEIKINAKSNEETLTGKRYFPKLEQAAERLYQMNLKGANQLDDLVRLQKCFINQVKENAEVIK